MIDKIKQFETERDDRIKKNGKDEKLKLLADKWVEESMMKNYVYNFSWLGRPIIQCPQDILALQEIIWDVKPDIIIETGIAHGGSLIFSATMLTLLEISGKITNGQVLGIDIDIREHNKKAINTHPMSKKITMFQGSSLDKNIIKKVYDFANKGKKMSESAKRKMRDAWIERRKRGVSEETRKKLSKAFSGKNHPLYGLKGKSNPNFGRKNSIETKRKMSLSAKLSWTPERIASVSKNKI